VSASSRASSTADISSNRRLPLPFWLLAAMPRYRSICTTSANERDRGAGGEWMVMVLASHRRHRISEREAGNPRVRSRTPRGTHHHLSLGKASTPHDGSRWARLSASLGNTGAGNSWARPTDPTHGRRTDPAH
jgi:hypothetical protein